jgi:hypothetical protein
VQAVAQVRANAVEAKEALSSDVEAAISVVVPGTSRQVRLTRVELEEMVREPLLVTVAALQRALQAASVTPRQLHAVLLVGGSSRMPLVAELLAGELGAPVAADAHPKFAVCLGAALVAGAHLQAPPAPGPGAGVDADAGTEVVGGAVPPLEGAAGGAEPDPAGRGRREPLPRRRLLLLVAVTAVLVAVVVVPLMFLRDPAPTGDVEPTTPPPTSQTTAPSTTTTSSTTTTTTGPVSTTRPRGGSPTTARRATTTPPTTTEPTVTEPSEPPTTSPSTGPQTT